MITKTNIINFPAAAAGQGAHHGRPLSETAAVLDFPNRHLASSAVQTNDLRLSASDVWDALNENRLVVHYQPQYDMATGNTVAAEALVRLIDTDGRLVYPDRFIEMVEHGDLIVPLGRSVIEQACADLAACRANGIALRRMAINVSARQLSVDTRFLSFVDDVIARFGLQYDDLEFELTERQNLAPNCDATGVINALAKRGVRIVIDDFGIGYSSVVYLTDLPISAFKLDRALVTRLPEDRAMRSVVKNLLTLAADLELDVVAEGIETTAQREFLARAGCHCGQGFGFAKPMGIGDLQVFLNECTSASLRRL